MIGSGVLSYNVPVASARTEPGQEAAPTAIGSYSKYITVAHPNTENLVEGWHWDNRIWSEDSIENSAMSVPTNWDPSISNITTTYFQSGIGSNSDLKLQSVELLSSSGVNEAGIYNLWAPKINHGYYYDFNEQGYLFSDDSEILYISYSGIVNLGLPVASGFNEVTLSNRPKVSIPIKVEQLEWSESLGKYTVATSLNKKVNFSGTRDSDGARITTYSSSTEGILWDNIDQSLDKFIVTFSGEYPKIILNKQYVEEVGGDGVPSGLETVGNSDGRAGQQFHTQYAPIDETMGVNIYSYITTSGTITQWEAIPFDTTPSGNQVRVDYDLGILEFGDSSISTQNVPSAGSTIGANYYKTFLAEYEPDYTQNTILATESNINSIHRRSSRGFVYLATRLEDPSSVTLSASLPEIQNNVFGPLTIGNAFASIIATVKDSRGQYIEGQPVQFNITSEPAAGAFGSYLTTTSITNENGQSYAFYNPPRGIADIGEEVTTSGWSQTNSPTEPEYSGYSQITTLQTNNLLVEGGIDDIFLYEVHTDDPLQGYLDPTLDHEDSSAQISGYYMGFFDEHEIQGSTRDIEWEDMHRTTWNLSRPSLFSTNAGLGRKKIVAKVDSTALNPHTFEYGAVSPVQPIDISEVGSGQYNIVFDTSSHSIPKPTGSEFPTPSGTLYSYFLVAPTTVRLQASVFNNRLNQIILSNEISVKLSIPSYLSGLWIVDAINQNHIDEISELLASGIVASGQHVPLGFRLRSSSVTLAAALDGVTFLDINRQWNYDPYDPDTVSGVRVGHQFTVSSGVTP